MIKRDIGTIAWIFLSGVMSYPVGMAQSKSPRDRTRMFDYDRKAALDIREIGAEDKYGVTVHDISYASSKSVRVTGYLVVPPGKGPFAGMLFLHGAGQDRSAFLDEALSLAKSGVVSLLIDVPSVRKPPHFTEPAADINMFIQTVVDLRRGIDVLLSRPSVNSARIGYVGMSFGSWMGGILAGVEKRITAYVLIAGPPSYSDIWRSSQHPVAVQVRNSLTKEQLERYILLTTPLDAVRYVGRAAPAALFFQFARHDETITESAALQYVQAGSKPKMVRWYETGHEDIFKNAEAIRDRAAWLRARLRLSSPSRLG
jgi:dienelactone hydrolase